MATATTDLEAKKTFLQQGSALYDEMIKLAPNDVIRRYLAFRIVVNAMAFEDLVGERHEPRMRSIRNQLLAHKQEDDFFKGQDAVKEISNASISKLLEKMTAEASPLDQSRILPENFGEITRHNLNVLVSQVFDKYNEDYISGYRVVTNYLYVSDNAVHEITKGDLPGVFYRYHSSKSLYDLAQYLYNNCYELKDRSGLLMLPGLVMHTKLDMLLHAQNMADSVIRDTRNPYSIDGLLEIMVAKNIGDPAPLQSLKENSKFKAIYNRVRHVRNKLVGHMDGQASLGDLISKIDNLHVSDHIDLVNMVDKAVFDAARKEPAIRMRYLMGNEKLRDPRIVGVGAPGREPPPSYY